MFEKLKQDQYIHQNFIRLLILLYWTFYWMLNSLDKYIGGSHFLWVGKDRFAQFERFFDSIGWGGEMVANIALVVVGALEIFAFLFFAVGLIQWFKKDKEASYLGFVWGMGFTLGIFTLFSIGDHLFGDRFELLEHTLFWTIALFSWVVFAYADRFAVFQEKYQTQRLKLPIILMVIALLVALNISIFAYKNRAYYQRRAAVAATQEGTHLYKLSFPFLAGSTSFEKSIQLFKNQNPQLQINQVYTVPEKLRKKKADGLVIYIATSKKEEAAE